MADLTVYTSQISPFCAVLHAFLDVEGIAHRRVEVDPWKRTILKRFASGDQPVPAVPLVAFGASEETPLSKAQEIIDAIQTRRGEGRCGPFTNAQKNQCMRISERVLPLVALNRHLTLASSRETVRFIGVEEESQWGWWRAFVSRHLVPVLYWRIWHKMGNAVMRDTGYAQCSPQQALVTELEKWQQDGKNGGDALFGGPKPNVVDVWLYGQIAVFKKESLYVLVSAHCPETVKFVANVERFL
jgi:hypothetical protein